mmetsp:Transcript_22836/g.40653  ORF Transcript_22836/g.40653 Transcript_22836/m.40653 type:complete len:213 (+) Transcript_22836:200-838(+)
MNRPIAEPFQCSELPELIEDYLEHKCARCCAFNRKGTLLAAGCSDGTVVLWDFETRGVALTLTGHRLGVISVSWSRNGRTLVSAGSDQCVIQWDVATRRETARVSVENTLTRVSLHPGGARAVVSCVVGPPLLVDFAKGSSQPLPLLFFGKLPPAQATPPSTPPPFGLSLGVAAVTGTTAVPALMHDGALRGSPAEMEDGGAKGGAKLQRHL